MFYSLWVMRGRERERGAIGALIHNARRGEGGGVLLHGEAGIGKTALLEYAAERAAGMRILRCAGAEPEHDLGYATLHELLLAVSGHVSELPAPQAEALKVVFGQVTGQTPDRFLVALATLSLLSQAAVQAPVVCLVDDAQWVDQPSLEVFTFLARRLEAEPIALIVSIRSDGQSPLADIPGLSDLPVSGLDAESARGLLADQIGEPVTSERLETLLRATGGNPLAIRELSAGKLESVESGAPLLVADQLRRAFHERVRRLGPTVQRLLLLVACDGSGRLDVLRRAAQAFDVSLDPLVSGELDSVLDVDGCTVSFRHPLIRSAVYYEVNAYRRRAAHQAIAAAFLDEPDEFERRAWHLGQATMEPDELVAAELEQAARRTSRRAGPAAAAATLTQAAELTLSDTRRVSRLMAAASAWWHSGNSSRAEALLEEVEGHPASTPATHRDAAGLRALIELRTGSPTTAVDWLVPVIPDALRDDLPRAVDLLMLFAEAGFDGSNEETETRIAAALEALPLHGTSQAAVLARLIRAVHRAGTGSHPGLEAGDFDAVDHITDPSHLAHAGGMMWALGHLDQSARLRRRAMESARAIGAAGALPSLLEDMTISELPLGRLGVAKAYATEGHQLAVETRQPNTACRLQALLALLAALHGRHREAEQRAQGVLVEAGEKGLTSAAATARRALGLVYLAEGAPETALDHLTEMFRNVNSSRQRYLLAFAPELVEAAVRANQPHRAREPVERLTAWANSTSSPSLNALAARCQALIASGDTAESEFRRALSLHAQNGSVLDQARTELLFGQYLRRERRRSDASSHLNSALNIFHRLGVSAWAEIASDELRASGQTPQPPKSSTLHELTPQETRIALAVAAGTRNREIAAQLFLSPRTVDYHLRRIFQKAGLSSRAELIRLVLTEQGQEEAGVDNSGRHTPD